MHSEPAVLDASQWCHNAFRVAKNGAPRVDAACRVAECLAHQQHCISEPAAHKHATIYSLAVACCMGCRWVTTGRPSTAAVIHEQDDRMHAERKRELNSVNIGALPGCLRAHVFALDLCYRTACAEWFTACSQQCMWPSGLLYGCAS